MIVQDIIYGSFEINEPVLIELINSKPIQRLKGIAQYGLPDEYYPLNGFSRYEHSIGVMLLLRKLGAELKEQIAGLLHDASHTAFSHVIDWVIGDKIKENYQDINHKKIINKSEIPSILKKHGISTEEITSLEKYNLLESEAPDLCADRLDYSIREFYYWANKEIVNECINGLIIHENKIIFKSKELTKKYALSYLNCQTNHWGGPDAAIRYHLLSLTLKEALKNKIIGMKDFYETDEKIIKKLKKSKNKNIITNLIKLSGKINYEISNEGIILRKKFRYVDPEFLINNKKVRLSENDNEFKELINKERTNNHKGMKIKIL